MTKPQSIFEMIVDLIEKAVRTEFDAGIEGPIQLAAPPEQELGDFAFACFPLARTLRMPPAGIASRLAPVLSRDDLFETVRAAGPYINFDVKKGLLARITLESLLNDPDRFMRVDTGQGKTVLIEYSAPNTNKPQHLGHVRNNVLGISIVNILEAAGFKVYPVNLVNDRGAHICKSMLAYEMFGNEKTPEDANVKGDHFVGGFYVRYDREEEAERQEWLKARPTGQEQPDSRDVDMDAAFLGESKLYSRVQEMLKKWENKDEKVRALWKKMNSWVLDGFDSTYKRLGCRFEKVYFESDTYTIGKELVKEGLDRGIFFKKDDGSVWVDLDDQGLDSKLLLRKDGTSVYITQDLGTTKLKFDDYNADQALWVVADEQIYHFKMLFAVLMKLGFQWARRCHHLAYGMVDLPEGKMKSRKGTVVDADDLMDELLEMEKEEIRSRDLGLSDSELEKTAEILAQGALKFFILKFTPKTRMTFNPSESISPEGFTGPYVQYAHVRIRSIFRKARRDMYASHIGPDQLGETVEKLVLPEEAAVVRRLCGFPEEVQTAAQNHNPSRLCTYLFELSREYNRFYHNLPVLGAAEEPLKDARLELSRAVALVIERGLSLLGIAVPERM